MRTLARFIGFVALSIPQCALAFCATIAALEFGWRNMPTAFVASAVWLAPLWVLWAVPTVFGLMVIVSIPPAQRKARAAKRQVRRPIAAAPPSQPTSALYRQDRTGSRQ